MNRRATLRLGMWVTNRIRGTALGLRGFVDVISPHQVAGWVWDSRHPLDRLFVTVRDTTRILAETKASRLRDDLKRAGIGDGYHSFDVYFAEPLGREAVNSLSVEVTGTRYQIPVAAGARQSRDERLLDCQVNVENIRQLMDKPRSKFDYIRFDSNFDCNLHCVYCHNSRSKDLVDAEDFRKFLTSNVISANHFQIGCVMEPTLDARLADLMLMVADSPARPRLGFVVQTNGILLHRHDPAKMRAAGMTSLSVSVDAAEPETQKLLRNGTSLRKVIQNVTAFRAALPDVLIEFITTVTSANIDKLESLVDLGLDIGIDRFTFREVVYDPGNAIVDHTRMPGLMLKSGQFSEMKSRLIDKFGTAVDFFFADDEFIERKRQLMLADSKA